ncbi:hypothetical protein Tco_1546492 [Tanacetum coccineum]
MLVFLGSYHRAWLFYVLVFLDVLDCFPLSKGDDTFWFGSKDRCGIFGPYQLVYVKFEISFMGFFGAELMLEYLLGDAIDSSRNANGIIQRSPRENGCLRHKLTLKRRRGLGMIDRSFQGRELVIRNGINMGNETIWHEMEANDLRVYYRRAKALDFGKHVGKGSEVMLVGQRQLNGSYVGLNGIVVGFALNVEAIKLNLTARCMDDVIVVEFDSKANSTYLGKAIVDVYMGWKME